jgi:hypothetical protein
MVTNYCSKLEYTTHNDVKGRISKEEKQTKDNKEKQDKEKQEKQEKQEKHDVGTGMPSKTQGLRPDTFYKYDPTKLCTKALSYMQYKRNKWSQNGEDGILQHMLKQLEIHSGWVCEFGASDGRWNSNTYHLMETFPGDWNAVYIEADDVKYKELLKLAASHSPHMIPIHAKVSPFLMDKNSLDKILSKHTTIPKDFDILSIDIDSCDYQVWKSLTNYNPKIVIIEIHSGVHPCNDQYIHEEGKQTGTSYLPMVRLGISKGYRLVCHTGNLIWLRHDLADRLCDLCQADPVTRPECYFQLDWLNAQDRDDMLRKRAILVEYKQQQKSN